MADRQFVADKPEKLADSQVFLAEIQFVWMIRPKKLAVSQFFDFSRKTWLMEDLGWQGRALAHAHVFPHRARPGDKKKAERGYGPLAARLRLQRLSASAGPQRPPADNRAPGAALAAF